MTQNQYAIVFLTTRPAVIIIQLVHSIASDKLTMHIYMETDGRPVQTLADLSDILTSCGVLWWSARELFLLSAAHQSSVMKSMFCMFYKEINMFQYPS